MSGPSRPNARSNGIFFSGEAGSLEIPYQRDLGNGYPNFHDQDDLQGEIACEWSCVARNCVAARLYRITITRSDAFEFVGGGASDETICDQILGHKMRSRRTMRIQTPIIVVSRRGVRGERYQDAQRRERASATLIKH